MDHFLNPRNIGIIVNPDGYGKIGSPVCGDVMEIFIKVKDDIITDVKFQTFGCCSAIASSSMATELVKGKHVNDAMRITSDIVTEKLDGLPSQKIHCSNLAADALHEAIKDYKKNEIKSPR